MNRNEYLTKTTEFALRGQDLPQAKLLDLDVVAIRSAVRQRESLRRYIAENLSNAALAEKYGVSLRTIERLTQYETWRHVI